MNELDAFTSYKEQKTLLNWLSCAVLTGVAFVIMLPVLISSQWGMFSDYNQIVAQCELLSQTHNLKSWIEGSLADSRPIVHLIDYLIWWCTPNQPRTYYSVRLTCFVFCVCLSYFNSYKLSGSSAISFCVSILWFLSPCTYEVLYTLDKGELLVAFLFSIYLWLDLNGHLMKTMAGQITSGVILLACMMTKQTGQLMVFYAVARVLTSSFLRGAWAPHPYVANPMRGKIKYLSMFFVVALSWVAFRIFYIVTGGAKLSYYNSVNYSIVAVLPHLFAYLQRLPEFTSSVLIILTCLSIKIIRDRKKSFANQLLMISLILLATVVGGAYALSGWTGNIIYGWFPLLALLIPSLSYGLSGFKYSSRLFTPLITLIALIFLLPERYIDAQNQFNMDQMFSEIPVLFAHIDGITSQTSVILPFDDKASSELGNTLRMCMSKSSLKIKPRIANLIQFAKDPDAPGLLKLTLKETGEWIQEKIEVGDIILVPDGDLTGQIVDYRGVPMFYKSWQAWTGWLGQLELRPIAEISRTVTRILSKNRHLRWVALRVTETPPISLATIDGGWIFQNSTIQSSVMLRGQHLRLKTRRSHRLKALILTNESESKLINAIDAGDANEFDIVLNGGRQRLNSYRQHESALFLIQDAHLVR